MFFESSMTHIIVKQSEMEIFIDSHLFRYMECVCIFLKLEIGGNSTWKCAPEMQQKHFWISIVIWKSAINQFRLKDNWIEIGFFYWKCLCGKHQEKKKMMDKLWKKKNASRCDLPDQVLFEKSNGTISKKIYSIFLFQCIHFAVVIQFGRLVLETDI